MKTDMNTNISNEDLDTMAIIFYLHKQNLEQVSYIYPEEVDEKDEFFECEQNDEEIKHEFHNCEEWDNTMFKTCKGRSKSFHLSVNHMTIGKEEKRQQHSVKFIKHDQIDECLNDMPYDELIGYHHSFNTLAFAFSTVDKLQGLEELQPKLAWKPLEVIKQTLKATTQ